MFKNKKYLIALTVLATLTMMALLMTGALAQESTVISNVLTAQASVAEKPVQLTWARGNDSGPTESFTSDPLALTLTLNQPFYIWVNAKYLSDFTKVLFIIEAPEGAFEFYCINDGTASGWTGVLPYDSSLNAYYFGPRQGFPVTADASVTSGFKVTPKRTGDFSVKVYAVQLP